MTALATTDNLNDEGAEHFPYVVSVTIEGTAPLLFHRWQDASVATKARAAKNSAAKKTDDVNSYVWRDADGHIGLPGVYLLGSIIDPKNGAAKYKADPRSPRKSALDLYKAVIVPMTELAPIIPTGRDTPTDNWDYLDSRRVTVQRAGVTRVRPAFLTGWRATIDLQCLAPEYVPPPELLETLTLGGRLVGLGDYRPMFGRFQIVKYDRVL